MVVNSGRTGQDLWWRKHRPFKGGVPFRSSSEGYQSGVETKLLTVGLGSNLYYGNHRGNLALLRAAEGFWTQKKDAAILMDGIDNQ